MKKYMNRLKITVYCVSLLVLGASCAREVSENRDELEQQYIDAYLEVNKTKYPDMKVSESGLCFLSRDTVKPLGEAPVGDDMIYIAYTSRTLAENIAETSVDSLARMLGSHSYTVDYGPKLFSVTEGATLAGLREAFLDMKTGEKVRVLLPSRLSTTGLSDTSYYDVPMLYDLELLRVALPDIATFQSDSLKRYQEIHYPTTQYPGAADTIRKDLYFVSLTPDIAGDPPAAEDTVIVRYVGYLLDGFVFDTNIKDTAQTYYKKNFDKTATYDALTVIMKEEVSSMDVVQGFSYALKEMKEGEEAVVFFSSDYGYQATTSGQIQPYSMLRFYIKVEHIGKP